MAKRTRVVMIDDLTGEEMGEGGQTLTFSVSGVDYSIDLSAENVGRFEAALQPYINVAERVGGRKSRGGSISVSAPGGVDPRAVRAWAASNGVKVSARGRIPAGLLAQYRAAGN